MTGCLQSFVFVCLCRTQGAVLKRGVDHVAAIFPLWMAPSMNGRDVERDIWLSSRLIELIELNSSGSIHIHKVSLFGAAGY